MNTNRDDFNKPTRETLAKRVGYRCSNPQCKKHTVGPHSEPTKSITLGIAAHIAAAAPGGPRYDPDMTKEERQNVENGIWLCSNCSILIDRDSHTYNKQLLFQWKSDSEKETLPPWRALKIQP